MTAAFHVSGGLWVEVDKGRGRIRLRQEIRPYDQAGSAPCTSILIELRVDQACDDWASLDEFVRAQFNAGKTSSFGSGYRPTIEEPNRASAPAAT